jgi:hypothetical protein
MNHAAWVKIGVSVVALSAVTVLAQAQTARWQKLLTNMMLSNVDSGSTKGGSVAGRAGETQTGLGNLGEAATAAAMGDVSGSSVLKLHLCSDKSFVLTMDDSASVPGMPSASSSSRVTGSWAISQATQVDAKVKLTPRKASDAKVLQSIKIQNFTVSFTGERTFVNQTRWYRMKSSVCKK